MPEITHKTVNEIVFLRYHALGPKMIPVEIANYLKIPEDVVRVCLENVELNHIFTADEQMSVNELHPWMTIRAVVKMMKAELKNSACFNKSVNIVTNNVANKLRMSPIGSDDDEEMTISYERWIAYCKHGWYEKLEELLGIPREEVTVKKLINEIFSKNVFSDKKFQLMYDAIHRELRFKRKVEPIEVSIPATSDACQLKYFPNFAFSMMNTSDSNIYCSFYSREVTMANFEITFDEILNTSENIDLNEREVKTVQISKAKYISMCENEWYELVLEMLGIPTRVLQPLDILLQNLYSSETFTDEKHKQMLDAIYREQKYKGATEKLVMFETVDGMQYTFYSPAVSVKSFEIVLEDILKVECPKRYDEVV